MCNKEFCKLLSHNRNTSVKRAKWMVGYTLLTHMLWGVDKLPKLKQEKIYVTIELE